MAMTTPIQRVYTQYAATIYGHLTALLGDVDAFARTDQARRWDRPGYYPLRAQALGGDGLVGFGYGGEFAGSDGYFSCWIEGGAVHEVDIEMSTGTGHVFWDAYVQPAQQAYPEATEAEQWSLAAARYTAEWLAGAQVWVAAPDVTANHEASASTGR
jgi:hypothetical protein